MIVTIENNDPPSIDAGTDQTVLEGATVTLAGTATDDGSSLTYGWTHDSDLAITLSDSAALTATFSAPAVDADTEVTFTLTVTDGPNTVADNVIVTIENNGSPTISAGTDQTVLEGATVTLAGTATDDGSSLTYGWTHDSDLAITLSDSAALTATFSAPAVDADTEVTFTLTVTDGPNTVTDNVIVTIENNGSPTVSAGTDQTVLEGATVTLAGTATDDGSSLTYAWSHDSTMEISFNASSPAATFAAPQVDADTTVTFTLTVSDGTANSTDTVLVTVSDMPDDTDFVTTWETTTPGDSITIPARGTYAIDWGDGTVDARVRGEQTHTYADAGNHTVRISDGITAIYLNDHADAPKLRSIDQWGDAEWGSMYSSFRGASNVVLHATDAPDLSRVKDTQYMFMDARSFDGDLSGWDVSSVTDMAGMFWNARSLDGNLSGWDVSSVTDMFAMFYNARSFDGDLSGWDVSSVTNMGDMFHGARSFNGDLSGWDVSSVTDMFAMFAGASSFNGDLSGWDVSSVTDMADTFRDASSFNGDISGWDVSSVTRMSTMLYNADSFDQNLGEWYIVLDDAVIDRSSVPGDVGRISAQNSFLDDQNPTYRVGTGGDSAHFKINGNTLKMKSVPDGHAGPYSVTITSTGTLGSENSRTFEISVTEGTGNAPSASQSDPRDVAGFTLSSTESGTIEITWDAPGETPRDYRVAWAKAGENFLPRSDLAGNAFPTSPGHTVTDLDEGEEYQVKVRARYDSGGSGDWSDAYTVTVAGTAPDQSANNPPVADAGDSQTVQEGSTVALSGTASDPDGDTMTYLWSHDSAMDITFSDPSSLAASFTAPAVDADTEVTFTLTVTDGPNTVTDNVIVTIENNDPPSIDAGTDQTVQEGATVTLAGTVTDDGSSLTYGWTHDSDLAITLSDSAALTATFSAPAVTSDTNVTFTLTVTDGPNTVTDNVIVTIENNDPPSIDAGTDQTVQEGATVTLAGTVTDDGSSLTYAWSHDSDLAITLSDSAALTATFSAPAVTSDTNVTFTLTVTDGPNTVTDNVIVTIENNDPPSIDAGTDQTVLEGATVTLAGTVTDDGSSLTYAWSHDSDLAITLSDSAALTATFSAPAVTRTPNVTFTLTVTDGPNTVTDNVIVTIENNDPPSIDAGTDQTVLEGATVTLAGTVTDDGSSLTYAWSHDSDLAITLSDSAALTATFSAPAVDADTEVTFTLTVTDGPNTVTDNVIVTIENNDPPSIDAGTDQTVLEGATVTLAGTVTDDGSSLTYAWSHDSDLAISLSDAAALSTTFTAPQVDSNTTITITLTVSDGNTTTSDSVDVTVADVPA